MANGINMLIAQGRPAPTFDWMESKKNALLLRQGEQELAAYPEEQEWKRTQRNMLQEKFGMEKTKFQQEQEERPFKTEAEAFDHLDKWGHLITLQNWTDSRQRLINRGINADLLPPREFFDAKAADLTGGVADPKLAAEYFKLWRDDGLKSIKTKREEAKAATEERKVKVLEAGIPLKAREVAVKEELARKGKEYQPKLFIKPDGGMDWVRPGDPVPPGWVDAAQRGIKVSVDKDGNITFEEGPAGGGSPAKGTQTKLEEDTAHLIEQTTTMKKAGADFKREYLTYFGRGKQFALNQWSKLGGDIGPEGKDFIGGMRTFVERIESHYQRWRKEITGAQAVMKELEMLRESVINKKLSPDEFEASYNRLMDDMEYSLRLKRDLMKQGFKGKELGEKIDALFADRKKASPMVSRDDSFKKLKAKGKWSDSEINTFLDKEGIK